MSQDKLIAFLDELSSSLKNNTLAPEQIKLVGEFYMLYNFKNKADPEDENFKKYLSTGWYIHNIILTNQDSQHKE
jgi:hypothetical protein